jgi:iron(III) transport system substrate-binding protein
MSIIKGAKNPENARKWYDWALTAAAQSLGPKGNISYQMPSNKNAFLPEKSPRLGDIKLIDYDFAKYGSSAERRRLLGKWDKEVKNLPK